jgi:hypothetical protein
MLPNRRPFSRARRLRDNPSSDAFAVRGCSLIRIVRGPILSLVFAALGFLSLNVVRGEPPLIDGAVEADSLERSARAGSDPQSSTPATAPAKNIALGRPYTMTPRPSYGLTSDTGDNAQLTDGTYTTGRLWRQAIAVGWTNAVPVVIVIDLGKIESISGVSYSTAAGIAGVRWPRSIFVLVSDDGQRFFPSGDLVAQAAADTPATGYAGFRFAKRDFETHGRHVALIVDPTGPYTFCDEIEVLSGDPAWVRTSLSGESTSDFHRFFVDARTRVSIARRLAADVGAVRRELESSSISAAVRTRLALELTAAENEADTIPTPPHDSFKAVLPLNAPHARIFAVHGQAAQARGRPPCRRGSSIRGISCGRSTIRRLCSMALRRCRLPRCGVKRDRPRSTSRMRPGDR